MKNPATLLVFIAIAAVGVFAATHVKKANASVPNNTEGIILRKEKRYLAGGYIETYSKLSYEDVSKVLNEFEPERLIITGNNNELFRFEFVAPEDFEITKLPVKEHRAGLDYVLEVIREI